MASAARQNGIAWGITAGTAEEVARWQGMGAQMVPWGGDFSLANVLKQCSADLDGVMGVGG